MRKSSCLVLVLLLTMVLFSGCGKETADVDASSEEVFSPDEQVSPEGDSADEGESSKKSTTTSMKKSSSKKSSSSPKVSGNTSKKSSSKKSSSSSKVSGNTSKKNSSKKLTSSYKSQASTSSKKATTTSVKETTTSTASVGAKTYSLYSNNTTTKEYMDKIKLGGRTTFLRATGLQMYWTGDSIEFNLQCVGDVTLAFSTAKQSTDSKVKVYVDGELFGGGFTIINAASSSLEVTDLEEGTHNFKIIRSDDGERQAIALASLKFAGSFADRPADNNYYIEALGGGSLTGWGALLSDDWFKEREESWSSADQAEARDRKNQDGTIAYPIIAAEAVGADISIVAHQGVGITTTYHQNSSKTEISADTGLLLNNYNLLHYSSAKTEVDHTARHPDVILIDCGATDLSNSCLSKVPNGGTIGINYNEMHSRTLVFFKALKEKHPNAKIVWCYNFDTNAERESTVTGGVKISLETHIKKVISELGGERAGYYSFKTEYRAIRRGYPSVADNKKTGTDLAAMLKGIL